MKWMMNLGAGLFAVLVVLPVTGLASHESPELRAARTKVSNTLTLLDKTGLKSQLLADVKIFAAESMMSDSSPGEIAARIFSDAKYPQLSRLFKRVAAEYGELYALDNNPTILREMKEMRANSLVMKMVLRLAKLQSENPELLKQASSQESIGKVRTAASSMNNLLTRSDTVPSEMEIDEMITRLEKAHWSLKRIAKPTVPSRARTHVGNHPVLYGVGATAVVLGTGAVIWAIHNQNAKKNKQSASAGAAR